MAEPMMEAVSLPPKEAIKECKNFYQGISIEKRKATPEGMASQGRAHGDVS